MSLWEWCNKEFQELTGNEKIHFEINNPYAGIPEIDAAMRIIWSVFPDALIVEVRKKDNAIQERSKLAMRLKQATFPFTGYKKGGIDGSAKKI